MAADLSPAAALLYRTGAPRDYPLSGSEASIGYEGGNAIRVAIEGVSRRHARITYDGNDYFLEDAGSSNGTFLNGIPVVQKERLRHLDIVGLGRRTELVFVRKAVGVGRTRRRGIVGVWLLTLDGSDAGERREIPRGLVTMGRAPSNNVVVRSELVSKAHARIERLGIELILTDLQSANGTFVNGKPVTTRTLEDGDEINLGKARTFRVQIQEGEIETYEINPSRTIDTTGGLPTDWKTRLEWSPEELAAFEWAREGAQGKAAPPAKKAEPEKKAEPAKKKEEPKGKEPPAAAGEKTAEKQSPKPPAAPAGQAAAEKPSPGGYRGAGKAAQPASEQEARGSAPQAAPPEPAPPPSAPVPPPSEASGKASESSPVPPAPAPAPTAASPAPEASPPASARSGVETRGVGSSASEAGPAPPPAPAAPPRPETRPAAIPAHPASPPPPAAQPPSGRGEQTVAVRLPPPVPAPLVSVGTGEPRLYLDGKLQSFSFAAGDYDIGRVPQCNVKLESPQISRRHAVLHVTASEILIEDLKSANGTFVNGKRVTDRQTLKDADELRFGDLRFQVRVTASKDLPQA
jgi:pSer/pThr/pTyr-binding forkhead associated (FHA) protein